MATAKFELDRCFPSDYVAARSGFLKAVENAGAIVESYVQNALGPSGEVLATDVALVGNPDANNVLVLVSGTHGVEGLAGSGLQVAQVQSGLRPPPSSDLAIILVHALNPFGLAFKRRVNEDSVDLNRNFATFPVDLPNSAYDELHGLLTMRPGGFARARRGIAFASYAAKRGKRTLQQAVTKGQFNHPTGLFFGGNKPSWSRNTWDQILKRLAGKQKVLVVDYHTGLGPRGGGQLISHLASAIDSGHEWRSTALADCFGENEIRYLEKDNSVSTGISGDLLSYTMNCGNQFAAVALEFGTYPMMQVLNALINENWAYHSKYPGAEKYRNELIEVFSPDDASWKRAVYERATAVSQAAIRGLMHQSEHDRLSSSQ
jgi:hypothetical protein